MNTLAPARVRVADYIDIVDTALATLSRRLPSHVERDDLASVGKIALVQALGRVSGAPDEVRAYCFVCVRGAMLDELRRLDPVSRRRRVQLNTVSGALAKLSLVGNVRPTASEIAAATGLSVREAASALDDLAAAERESGFDWETLSDPGAPSPAEAVDGQEIASALLGAVARLPANQAFALRRYYLDEVTLDAIADELGVSRERARQIREAGEKKLRSDFQVLALWRSLIGSP
ncbi:hypothetical protein DB347_02255 [Opitutaceae bacterium EW11]|nr:hypothetical protein DB347_02255 [Opitutaceae bacterium EW11]